MRIRFFLLDRLSLVAFMFSRILNEREVISARNIQYLCSPHRDNDDVRKSCMLYVANSIMQSWVSLCPELKNQILNIIEGTSPPNYG